jgi:hypothetical protein
VLLPLALRAQLLREAAAAGGGACLKVCRPQRTQLQTPQRTGQHECHCRDAITTKCCCTGARPAGRGPALHRALGREGCRQAGRRQSTPLACYPTAVPPRASGALLMRNPCSCDLAPRRCSAGRLRRSGPQVLAVVQSPEPSDVARHQQAARCLRAHRLRRLRLFSSVKPLKCTADSTAVVAKRTDTSAAAAATNHTPPDPWRLDESLPSMELCCLEPRV